MQFLLERLVNRTDPSMGLAPAFDMADAVAAQIQRIVACRPDVGARDLPIDAFGMPSIVHTSIGLHDMETYGARLARAIAHYEPRLQDVRLEWLPTGMPLRPQTLVVHGRLVGSVELRSFRFELPASCETA